MENTILVVDDEGQHSAQLRGVHRTRAMRWWRGGGWEVALEVPSGRSRSSRSGHLMPEVDGIELVSRSDSRRPSSR
jgi:hypothetical protein